VCSVRSLTVTALLVVPVRNFVRAPAARIFSRNRQGALFGVILQLQQPSRSERSRQLHVRPTAANHPCRCHSELSPSFRTSACFPRGLVATVGGKAPPCSRYVRSLLRRYPLDPRLHTLGGRTYGDVGFNLGLLRTGGPTLWCRRFASFDQEGPPNHDG
jgi:hypothetical protein